MNFNFERENNFGNLTFSAQNFLYQFNKARSNGCQ